MKALMYMGPRNMPIVEVDEPFPSDNEVKIAVKYVGICGSDLHGYTGESQRRIPPMIMGHEFSGSVVAAGKNVKRFKTGDRVTVQPVTYCGECEYCKQGLVNICANRRGLGVMDVNGCFAEYICMEERYVYPLADTISYEAGAMIEPLSVAYHAIAQVMPIKDKTMLIVGSGTIGLLILKLAKYFGARTVAVTDLNQDRLDVAKELGADMIINQKTQDLDKTLSAAGIRDTIDIAVECVGITPTAELTVEYVRIKGLVLWVGNAAKTVSINMPQIVTRELVIKGTYAFTENDFSAALGILAEGVFDISGLITSIVPMTETVTSFETLLKSDGKDIKILVDMEI